MPTSVGYPVTDLIMVVIVLLIAVFRRPRHPQVLVPLGAGLVALSVSDSFFLYLVLLDEPTMPPLYDVGFVAGPVLIGLAALAPGSASRPRGPTQEAREGHVVHAPAVPAAERDRGCSSSPSR